jgi:hypothetical protein
VEYLGRLRALGLPTLMVDGERDAWILVAAQLPEHMPLYMKLKQRQLDDPAVVDLYRELAEVIHWPEDDARVAAVGDHLVASLEAAEAAAPEGWEAFDQQMPDELAALLDAVFLDSVPVARRLLDRLEERGWRGWTKLERIPPAQDAS